MANQNNKTQVQKGGNSVAKKKNVGRDFRWPFVRIKKNRKSGEYVGMLTHIARVRINRIRLRQSCSWSAEQGKLIFLCPRSRLKIWPRETGPAVPFRVSLLMSILRLNLVLNYRISPKFRGGVHLYM